MNTQEENLLVSQNDKNNLKMIVDPKPAQFGDEAALQTEEDCDPTIEKPEHVEECAVGNSAQSTEEVTNVCSVERRLEEDFQLQVNIERRLEEEEQLPVNLENTSPEPEHGNEDAENSVENGKSNGVTNEIVLEPVSEGELSNDEGEISNEDDDAANFQLLMKSADDRSNYFEDLSSEESDKENNAEIPALSDISSEDDSPIPTVPTPSVDPPVDVPVVDAASEDCPDPALGSASCQQEEASVAEDTSRPQPPRVSPLKLKLKRKICDESTDEESVEKVRNPKKKRKKGGRKKRVLDTPEKSSCRQSTIDEHFTPAKKSLERLVNDNNHVKPQLIFPLLNDPKLFTTSTVVLRKEKVVEDMVEKFLQENVQHCGENNLHEITLADTLNAETSDPRVQMLKVKNYHPFKTIRPPNQKQKVKNPNQFVCKQCDAIFDSWDKRREHYLNGDHQPKSFVKKKQEKKLICRKCSETFSTDQERKNHYYRKHITSSTEAILKRKKVRMDMLLSMFYYSLVIIAGALGAQGAVYPGGVRTGVRHPTGDV